MLGKNTKRRQKEAAPEKVPADALKLSSGGTLSGPKRCLAGRPRMTVQQLFPSVADMMRKQASPAEAHLITRAWSPPKVVRDEGPARSN
jgi:hypothetical protein